MKGDLVEYFLLFTHLLREYATPEAFLMPQAAKKAGAHLERR